jgi:hypothetical protein
MAPSCTRASTPSPFDRRAKVKNSAVIPARLPSLQQSVFVPSFSGKSAKRGEEMNLLLFVLVFYILLF